MTRGSLRWLVLALLALPIVAMSAQRFGRRSPGETPNPNVGYDGRFTFVRVKFEPLGGGRDLKWDHDYPTAETHLMKILDEVSSVKPHLEGTNILSFADTAIFDYPVAYVSEPGFWTMSDEELAGVQAYVRKGGFLIFDDFADRHWLNFERQWRRAFPDLVPVKLELSHPVFDSFFRIKSLEMQHPNFRVDAEFWGAFEDNDPSKRLVMIANYNNDIGDYMEFSDRGFLPVSVTNEAYKLAVNYVVYALTH
ncbi:MAG: DUF4159 domain-containing protein [Gemmatimonadaceae bacterium]|jgi:hypothetical protein|nr:DUF4159 domain-containing protein [Gemmatimonadaceae bacterium]